MQHAQYRVIAVTSGKGGVGKTTVAINLSTAIASLGKGVTLMDADLGLANVDVMLGLKPLLNLSRVLDGLCSLKVSGLLTASCYSGDGGRSGWVLTWNGNSASICSRVWALGNSVKRWRR